MYGEIVARKSAKWRQREADIINAINSAYWFVAKGERALAKHRGEMATMKLADIAPPPPI